MRTKIHMWGNSLALRIPKAFAADARIENESVVEVLLLDGQIVVRPVIAPKLTLEQLLAVVTAENLHHETDTGLAVGNEVW